MNAFLISFGVIFLADKSRVCGTDLWLQVRNDLGLDELEAAPRHLGGKPAH